MRFNEHTLSRNAAEYLSANRKRTRTNGGVQPMYTHSAGGLTGSLSSDPKRQRRGSNANASPMVSVATAAKAASSLMRESPAYKRLVEMEEKLDLAIMRKQQDIREALKQQQPVDKRTFRLYIFNTYRSQPGTEGVTDEDVPSWSLRIQGQLLPSKHEATNGGLQMNGASMGAGGTMHNNNMHHGNLAQLTAGMDPRTSAQYVASMPHGGHGYGHMGMSMEERRDTSPRCSDVFKRIIVELDDKLYPENNLIEWQRNERDQPAHGFEISRKGKEECQVRMFFDVNHQPELFKLSVPLSRLLGVSTDTRSGVFLGVWQYIKKMGLQNPTDRTIVRMDAGLKSLLAAQNNSNGADMVKLHHLYDVVKSHLAPPDRLEIVYNIKLSGDVIDNQDCYDIQINMEDTLLSDSAQKSGIFGLSFPRNLEYQALKEKHVEALEKILLHKRRRDFFEGFCRNPVEFINHLILSQTRDLKVLGGSTGRNPEEERRASFYQQQWVHEAIPRYLLRKAISDIAKKTQDKTGM